MPRCPDCNKFVSLDSETEPEVDLEVSDDGTVTGTAMIVNNCGDCGTEMAAAELEVSIDPESICAPPPPDAPPPVEGAPPAVGESLEEHLAKLHDPEASLEVEDTSRERTDRYEGKGRGQRHYYGARLEVEVTCSCGWVGTGEWTDDVQASGMDPRRTKEGEPMNAKRIRKPHVLVVHRHERGEGSTILAVLPATRRGRVMAAEVVAEERGKPGFMSCDVVEVQEFGGRAT